MSVGARNRWIVAWLAVLSLGSLAIDPCQAQTLRELTLARARMVETDIATAGITHPAVLAAIRTTPRHEFVPADLIALSYFDMALPIGEHQTISPPFIVAYMTEKLDPKPTDRVLEIGTGSGYQAAVLSPLVKDVYTIEINDKLAKQAAAVFKRLDYANIHARAGDGFAGWPEHAPFDKIIVTCSPEKIPAPLVEQLREGGRLVIPLGERFQQTLCTMTKHDGRLAVESREATFFVPMTGAAEKLRAAKSSEPLTAVTNGSFEELFEPGKPTGWYYLRQATLSEGGAAADSQRCLKLENAVPGRVAQALQALGVDGQRVKEMSIDLWVQGDRLSRPTQPDEGARVVVSYFDDQRSPVGQAVVGPWSGNFSWQHKTARVGVPKEARTAILAIGLMGATGQLSCDQVAVRAATLR